MTHLENTFILQEIHRVLVVGATTSPEQVKRFFKTAPGSYGEKDVFMGVTVPVLRKIAKQFAHVATDIIGELLRSRFNEERMLALLILVGRYQKAEGAGKEAIYQFYLQNLKYVNNWNLVDASAYWIVGAHLWDKDRSLLEALANSNSVWERRIAIVSTWYFIRKGDLTTTFQIAERLLNDSHDLIHKATGWMLREAGKRNEKHLLNFLHQQSSKMPKTMLRYAMERIKPRCGS